MAIPIGLSANKSLMDNSFKQLIIDNNGINNGVMFDAAYNAYFEINKKYLEEAQDVEIVDADLKPLIDAKLKESEEQLKSDARAFAKTLCGGIEEVLKEISKQIDAHVKALKIEVKAPTPGPSGTTLSSPLGPCAGTIILSNLTPPLSGIKTT